MAHDLRDAAVSRGWKVWRWEAKRLSIRSTYQKSVTRDAGAQLSLPFLFSIQSETLACRMAPPTLRVVLLASQIHP